MRLPATAVRALAALLALACLVLAYSAYLLEQGKRRLGLRYGETYSARVLAEVRLDYAIDLMDEKSAELAGSAADRGDTLRALTHCADLCALKTPLCDSLRLEGRIRRNPMVLETHGASSAVCSWLKTGKD